MMAARRGRSDRVFALARRDATPGVAGGVLVALIALGCGDVSGAPSALGEDPTRTPDPVAVAVESPRVAQLPQASQETLRQARLPLLLPSDRALLANAIVMAGPHFSALSAQGDGWSLSISGTDHRHELAEELAPPAPTDQVRGAPATFTQNDGIRTVTWDEAGLAWAVDVECFDVENDPRCASDDFVRGIAEHLELVGGGP